MQACLKHPFLRELLARGLTWQHIKKRAKSVDKTLRIRKAELKPAFSNKHKQARYDFCMDMLSKPPEFLQSIVWVDESSVPFVPAPPHYVGNIGDHYTVTDSRVPKDKRHTLYIHYILAVCYATGLVRLDILSFTPGYDNPIQYQVSATASFAHLPLANATQPGIAY